MMVRQRKKRSSTAPPIKMSRERVAIIILVALILSGIGFYVYAYYTVTSTLEKSFQTFKVEGFVLKEATQNQTLREGVLRFSIINPTNTSIIIESMSFTLSLDRTPLTNITLSNRYLPPSVRTVFTGDFYTDPTAASLMKSATAVRVMGKIKASTSYQFINVTYDYPFNIVIPVIPPSP